MGPPTQLLGIGQAGDSVDGHDCSRQRKLTMPCGDGHESPDTSLGLGREQATCAAVAAPGLGDALDLVHRAVGEVTAVQELGDRTGRPTGGHRCGFRVRQGGRRNEWAAVDQAAGVDRQSAPQRCQFGYGRKSVTGRAQHDLREAAPATAVARRASDAAADVPLSGSGHPLGRQLVRVQADG